jgi:hypothetical protein
MTINNNRELSQFGSFITINDPIKVIGMAVENLPKVAIGTDIATSKFTVVGDSSFGDVVFSGITTFNGNVSFGNSTSDTISFTSRVNSNFLPSSTGTVNLGSDSNKWNQVYANEYKNFKFSDLPTLSEPSFSPNRILKTKSDGSGYELIEIFDFNTSLVESLNVSIDGTVYTGIGSTSNISNTFQISGISTSKFSVGESVKVFGATPVSAGSNLVPAPIVISSSATKVGNSSTISTYHYWISQYHLRNGKVGVSSAITQSEGIGMTTIDNFNDINFVTLNLSRTDTNHGILIYRQIGTTPNINQAKLIAILGPNEMGSNTQEIIWNDYGTFDQTEWSTKGTVNEFDVDQIHFPNIATTGHRRGWGISTILQIGPQFIRLSEQFSTNVGFGTDASVKVVHDNTSAFKNAIELSIAAGKNSLELPSGTYLTNKLSIPSGFTLSGNGKNTVIKMQYFASDASDGGGNLLPLSGNLVSLGTTSASNITIKDITFDGNSTNNILYSNSYDNYLVNLENISSSLIKDIEIRNSPGHGLYVYNSRRISIENSSIVDGCLSDRESYQPLNAQESETIRVNDCLFENYPGPVDLSVTNVALASGNIIRNCGTGLRIFAAGKFNSSNNIILGPSDEFIPSPDIYDSDYSSINLTAQRGSDFIGPIIQYIENGEPKDISSTKVSIVSAGIGTIVGQGTTNETLGSRFLNFNITTLNSGEFGRQNGYIQLSLTSTQTSTLGLTSSLGYDIIAKEFIQQPFGITDYIGIQTGSWNAIGAGATQYTVTLSNPDYFSLVSVGDVVKLVNHSVSPDLSSNELLVSQKIDEDLDTKKLVLTGITTTSITHGNQSGYISMRNIFTIAKGRVGVI